MRTLIRNIRTGEYLQSFETWSSSPELALDFGSVEQAFEVIRRRGLRDMEFVVSDALGVVSSVPAAKIGYEYHLAEPPPASRSRKKLRGRCAKALAAVHG